jgi:hypothetical protein
VTEVTTIDTRAAISPDRAARSFTKEYTTMSAQISVTKVKPSGLHGLRIGNEISQMIFADPADAVIFAQRLKPVRGGEKIEIVPVVVAEKIEKFRR